MNQDDIMRIAQEAFDKEFPEYAAELAMYDAGSPAVSALDTIVARRALSVWKLAYAAGAAEAREACAKVCEGIYTNGDGAECWLKYAAKQMRARGNE